MGRSSDSKLYLPDKDRLVHLLALLEAVDGRVARLHLLVGLAKQGLGRLNSHKGVTARE
jgi:hypothetical protein